MTVVDWRLMRVSLDDLRRKLRKVDRLLATGWLSTFFYMEAKLGPLEKRIKND